MMSDNVYLYKNKVVIPPLEIKDEMNNFMILRANIMVLEYGNAHWEEAHKS